MEVAGERGMEGAQPGRGVSKLARGCSIPIWARGRRAARASESEERERVRAREKGERLDASISVHWGSRVGWERIVTAVRVVCVRVRPDWTDVCTVSIPFFNVKIFETQTVSSVAIPGNVAVPRNLNGKRRIIQATTLIRVLAQAAWADPGADEARTGDPIALGRMGGRLCPGTNKMRKFYLFIYLYIVSNSNCIASHSHISEAASG